MSDAKGKPFPVLVLFFSHNKGLTLDPNGQSCLSVGDCIQGMLLISHFSLLPTDKRRIRANLSLSWGSDPSGIAALSRESAIRRAGSSFWLLVRIIMVVMIVVVVMVVVVMMCWTVVKGRPSSPSSVGRARDCSLKGSSQHLWWSSNDFLPQDTALTITHLARMCVSSVTENKY